MTDDERDAGPGGLVPCEQCDALNPPGATFCGECGVKVVRRRAADDESPARRRRGAAAGDAVERSRQRQEFARIKSIVPTVRFVFWSSAILGAIMIALWHTAFAPALEYAYGGWYLAMTLLVYGQFVLMVAGALLALRAPLLWTAIGACNWTLNTAHFWWVIGLFHRVNRLIDAYEVSLDKIELAMPILFCCLWTLMLVAFWFAVGQAARVQRLLADNPELQIVRRKLDPSRRVHGGVAEGLRDRRRRERATAWRTRLLVGGMVVAGVAVLSVVVWFATRPPAVDASLARFAGAWSRGDTEAIGAMLVRGSIAEELERRGWHQRPPALDEPEVRQRGSVALASYPCGDAEVEARFELVGGRWQLLSVGLPLLEPSRLEPAIDAFRRAWQAPGMDGLLDLLRPSRREELGGRMHRLFEGRGWDRQRPQLGDEDAGRVHDGKVTVLFTIGFDELKVRFEYWHPRWCVTGLIPPAR